jgi:hypothetical protein
MDMLRELLRVVVQNHLGVALTSGKRSAELLLDPRLGDHALVATGSASD